MLTVADIDRWSADAVRTVFHAATARGQATLDASRQLSSLAVFDSWEGATAEARKHTNASIRQDLDAHGNESLAVAQAAAKAADDIEHVQSKLRTLRHDAAELHMQIDPLSNKIVPTSAALPTEALIAENQLQPQLNAILAEANAVDQELATAINMADGDIPVPPGAGVRIPGGQLDAPPPGENTTTGQWQLDTSRAYDEPFSSPQGPYIPWRPTTIPEKLATGPTTGLLSTDKTGLSNTANGFDLQQGYKIRLTGGQATGITKMVQGADGKWYQARWVENTYEMQTTKVLQGTGSLGGITGYPLVMPWKPVSLGEIMNTSAMYPGKTFYLPDGCGGSIPIVNGKLPTPTVPVMTAPH
ncbi:hypothetical protein X011_26410 [Mycobacterium tuberculosis variant microti OV254]|nr:hypothetical protein X011_26410 [Mycobacterium tuberculosis variant microti OV254]BBX39608.1 hypothetical protein MSIM_10590 [Mycobacterium simiae]